MWYHLQIQNRKEWETQIFGNYIHLFGGVSKYKKGISITMNKRIIKINKN